MTNLRRQHGFTLLEMMIVIAIAMALLVVGYSAIRRVRKSELGENAVEVVAILQNAYRVAAESGTPARVLFDFQAQTFSLEVCPDAIELEKTEHEKEIGAKAAATEVSPFIDPAVKEMMAAASPEEAVKMAAALQGKSVGGARCEAYAGSSGDADLRDSVRKFRTEEGVKLRQIYVQHLEEPALDGIVTLTFFPIGYAEKAVIEVGTDDGDYFSILVYGLSGRVELREGKLHDPDDHMLRDAKGDEVADR